ncbi:AbrB/MazE/SpoVT family DNA-binding domain-containing protein [Methanobacterium formicicum]|nr:AbrB/MazE/SpoVT family DNA-binding domain-containing protein [Methanobacterium formicicum]
MKMIRTSKVGRKGGSVNVTIPQAIADLFEIKEGDVIKWTGIVGDGTPTLCVEKEASE